VDISVTVCLFVCLFVRLRISPPRIKLAASNFARRFIDIQGRESPILGNFASFLRSPKSDESASMADRRQSPPLTENARGTPGHALGMCGYTTVPPDVLVRISAIPVSQKYDR